VLWGTKSPCHATNEPPATLIGTEWVLLARRTARFEVNILGESIYTGLRVNEEAVTLKKERGRSPKAADRWSDLFQEQGAPDHTDIRSRTRESPSNLVFGTREGKAIRSIRTAFTNACQRDNLSHVRRHILSHTFA
jgi:hypothetical protein